MLAAVSGRQYHKFIGNGRQNHKFYYCAGAHDLGNTRN
jgi:hypothetical protein